MPHSVSFLPPRLNVKAFAGNTNALILTFDDFPAGTFTATITAPGLDDLALTVDAVDPTVMVTFPDLTGYIGKSAVWSLLLDGQVLIDGSVLVSTMGSGPTTTTVNVTTLEGAAVAVTLLGGIGGSLALATWDGDSYEYLGGEPGVEVQVIFVGPSDPTTAPGGRDVTGDVWIDDTGGGSATITAQDEPPDDPEVGDLWIDTDDPGGSGSPAVTSYFVGYGFNYGMVAGSTGYLDLSEDDPGAARGADVEVDGGDSTVLNVLNDIYADITINLKTGGAAGTEGRCFIEPTGGGDVLANMGFDMAVSAGPNGNTYNSLAVTGVLFPAGSTLKFYVEAQVHNADIEGYFTITGHPA